MYNQIKEIADGVTTARASLVELSRQLDDLTDNLQKQEKELKSLTGKGNRLQLDALLVRKVADKLASTGDLSGACRMVADETGLAFDCVYFAFTHAKQIRKVLDRYAIAYACQRLKKRGLNAKQIADLLGISEVYTYKLLAKKLPDEVSGKDLIRGKV